MSSRLVLQPACVPIYFVMSVCLCLCVLNIHIDLSLGPWECMCLHCSLGTWQVEWIYWSISAWIKDHPRLKIELQAAGISSLNSTYLSIWRDWKVWQGEWMKWVIELDGRERGRTEVEERGESVLNYWLNIYILTWVLCIATLTIFQFFFSNLNPIINAKFDFSMY